MDLSFLSVCLCRHCHLFILHVLKLFMCSSFCFRIHSVPLHVDCKCITLSAYKLYQNCVLVFCSFLRVSLGLNLHLVYNSTQYAEMLMMSACNTAMICSMNFAWFPYDTMMCLSRFKTEDLHLAFMPQWLYIPLVWTSFASWFSFSPSCWALFWCLCWCTKIQNPLHVRFIAWKHAECMTGTSIKECWRLGCNQINNVSVATPQNP